MTTTGAPETRREIRDRLNEIAPCPKRDTPNHARAMAKYLAVNAQRHWKYNLDIADMDSDSYRQAVRTMMAEFAALHLLMRLRETDPDLAREVSHQIRDAWDDGGEIGSWLWEHTTALGIDIDEVGRLEAAWWAAPEAPGHAKTEDASQDDGDTPDEITRLRDACQLLGRVVSGQVRAMRAAQIEMAQGSTEKAMQWILDSLPDVDDNPPEDQWNGTKTAQEWFDRTDERRVTA